MVFVHKRYVIVVQATKFTPRRPLQKAGGSFNFRLPK